MKSFHLITLTLFTLTLTACGEGDEARAPFDVQVADERTPTDHNRTPAEEDVDPSCRLSYGHFDGDAVDTCPGTAVCHDGIDGDGTCVAAHPRRWSFLLYGFMVPTRDSNGDCWDALCGAPDPIIDLWVNDDLAGSVGPFQDTFEGRADLAGPLNVIAQSVIREGDEITIVISDSDLSQDDPVLHCTLDVGPPTLKRRLFFCTDGGDSVISFIAQLAD